MIPKTVDVAGIEYKVKEAEDVIIDGSNQYLGACFYKETELQVRSDLPNTKKEQVFVHELLHAIFHEAGFDDQDEGVINRVGIVLYQVLKSNKLVFETEEVDKVDSVCDYIKELETLILDAGKALPVKREDVPR